MNESSSDGRTDCPDCRLWIDRLPRLQAHGLKTEVNEKPFSSKNKGKKKENNVPYSTRKNIFSKSASANDKTKTKSVKEFEEG